MYRCDCEWPSTDLTKGLKVGIMNEIITEAERYAEKTGKNYSKKAYSLTGGVSQI